MLGDGFSDIGPLLEAASTSPGIGKGKKRHAQGTEREYLKIYETLPCQMLDAYGAAPYPRLTDAQVWAATSEPMKTGAKYMTEYASQESERRGVAINRWLQPVLEYCRYQKSEAVVQQDK